MNQLQRITTAYSETEDRLRLAGKGAHGQTVVLWLTQRLMNRLVAHLCAWLDQHGNATTGTVATQLQGTAQSVAQSFAQQAAAAALAPKPPVQVAGQATQALVHSVDVSSHAQAQSITLRFKGQASHDPASDTQAEVQAQLGMNATALRQWLGIVYGQYRVAQWPTGAWPQWMEEASQPGSAPEQSQRVLWH